MTRRYRAKADRNQPQVVKALRAAGWAVRHTHTIGQGWPDLVVAKQGVTAVVEIKMPGEKLTDAEVEFFETWPGAKMIVYDEQDAVDKAGALL